MQDLVTPADAERFLTDADGSATVARLKMLARMWLATQEHTATDARDRMIQRRNRKEDAKGVESEGGEETVKSAYVSRVWKI